MDLKYNCYRDNYCDQVNQVERLVILHVTEMSLVKSSELIPPKDPKSSPKYPAMNPKDSESDDPGIFFILSTQDKIHNCVGLPAVANVIPTLQRGGYMRIL